MKAATAEWVQKAEGDYDIMLLAYRARKSPNYDAACFHAQQCVKKYLKGRLQESSIGFRKTHDLTALLELADKIEPSWLLFKREFEVLTDAAVDVRYPGVFATKQKAKESIATAKNFRERARLSLGLK